MTTGVTPISSDSRPPQIRRDSMSRPSSSVPSRCPSVPMGLRRLTSRPSSGSMGAISGAKIAASRISSSTKAAAIAVRSRLSLPPTLRQKPALRTGAGWVRTIVASAMAYLLMRGSSALCITSTIRFSTTKNSARTRIVPCNSGRSRWKMAEFSSIPVPGQLNTVSIRMEPPSR